ncbi:MAG: DUF177 domain-containing protein [Firmicutes bacterium]|nr:DUF177 domain-containing protein [Bacillota bacterium]
MLVDISDIKGVPGSSMDFEYKGKLFLEGIRLSADNVKLKLKVTNAGSRILLRGSIEGSVELSCSRCGEPFIQEMSVRIVNSRGYEDFVEVDSPEAKFPGEVDIKSLEIFTYRESESQIKIEEAIRQNLISEIPMQPICSGDCRGLCPVCGKNQNHGECQCAKEAVDPGRLPLLTIKRKKNSDYSGKVRKNG